jgi:hypothetical protein
MVNRERVQFLVDALRSGEYQQGHGYLKYEDVGGASLHCCLGVACEIAILNGVPVASRVSEDGITTRFDGSLALLPRRVRDWYGFDAAVPRLILENGSGEEATAMNDGLDPLNGDPIRYFSFTEIAAAFERTFLKEESDGES